MPPRALTIARTPAANVWLTALGKLRLGGRTYSKVFAIGFNKTGTSSIHEIFRQCGMISMHKRRWRMAWRPLVHWSSQGFSDGPCYGFRLLDRRFPRSLFILNTRDLDDWLDSRIEHAGGGVSVDQVQGWVRARNALHARVLDYFKDRPEDLLIVNYIRDVDAAAKIRRFIGHEAGFSGKPHINLASRRRADGALRHRQLIERAMTALGVERKYWQDDLVLPSLEAALDRS